MMESASLPTAKISSNLGIPKQDRTKIRRRVFRAISRMQSLGSGTSCFPAFQETGLHPAFSLHVKFAAIFKEAFAPQFGIGRLVDLNAARRTVRFHLPGGVHGFAPDVVAEFATCRSHVALLFEQMRRDAGIHAAAHAHDDARPCLRRCGNVSCAVHDSERRPSRAARRAANDFSGDGQ